MNKTARQVIGTIVAVQLLAATALAAEPEADASSALRYSPVVPGTTITVVGEVYLDGLASRRSTSTTTVRPRTTVNSRSVVPYEMTAEYHTPDGTVFDSAMTIYQQVDLHKSCTIALGFPGGEQVDLNCEDVDLRGPVARGTSWTYTTQRYPYAGNVRQLLDYTFEAVIEEVGIVRTVDTQVFSECARVVIRGTARPESSITCPDDETALARIESTSTRIVCPDIGGVHTTTIELYYPADNPSAPCSELRSEYKTTAFARP